MNFHIRPSRSVLLCVPVWLKDRCLDLFSTSSTLPADIQKLVESLGFGVHLYADDTQVHGSCKVSEAADLAGHAMRVVNEIKIWMSSNRLRLNAEKTQFIWLGTGHFLGRCDMQAIDAVLSSTDVVNDLGV